MTPERQAEIEKLAEAATPGPWEACGCRFSIVTTKISPQESMDVCDTKINDAISCEQAERNNYFIAAARTAIPELLAAVRERDAELSHEREATQVLGMKLAERDAEIERLKEEAVDLLTADWPELAELRSKCERLESYLTVNQGTPVSHLLAEATETFRGDDSGRGILAMHLVQSLTEAQCQLEAWDELQGVKGETPEIFAALRSRCAALEAVREAAEKVIHDEIHGSISREIWAAFKAALSAARGE